VWCVGTINNNKKWKEDSGADDGFGERDYGRYR
jgi:hypothetical protein